MRIPEHEADVPAEVSNWDMRRAEEVAAITFEILAARKNLDRAECLNLANLSAEKWLDMLEKLVDSGDIKEATCDDHRREWRRVEVES
jgi:predicted transcriptional regulator